MPNKGIASQIVVEALTRAGYTSEIKFDKWERVLQGAKMGVYDIIITAWKTPQREKNLYFSDAYLKNEIVLVSRKLNKFEYNKYSDLYGQVIGTIRGYAYDTKFINDNNLIKLEANRLTQNLLALMNGKIDLAIGDKYLVQYEINKFMGKNASKFQIQKKPLSVKNLTIAISKQTKNAKIILSAFNKEIKKMKQDGTIKRIIAAYTKP